MICWYYFVIKKKISLNFGVLYVPLEFESTIQRRYLKFETSQVVSESANKTHHETATV